MLPLNPISVRHLCQSLSFKASFYLKGVASSASVRSRMDWPLMGDLISRCICGENNKLPFCLSFYPIWTFLGACCKFLVVSFSDVCRVPSSVRCGSGGARGAVNASVLDDVERAVTGSTTVVEGKEGALQSLSVMIRSVAELVLDVGPSSVAVSSSVDPGPSIVPSGSLSAGEDTLRFKRERVSVTFSSPEPVDVCVGTTANVDEGIETTSVGTVDVGVQTED